MVKDQGFLTNTLLFSVISVDCPFFFFFLNFVSSTFSSVVPVRIKSGLLNHRRLCSKQRSGSIIKSTVDLLYA